MKTVSRPWACRTSGWLKANEQKPSTWPWTSGVGSNCTGTMVMSDSLRPARFRIVDHGPRAPDWSPIFFPTASFGVRMGFFDRLTKPDGAFWYIVPIATTGIPLARSEEHTSELQSRPHLVCRLLLEK